MLDELAEALGITVSAVRQHLQTLAAAELVSHREQRGTPGRPKHAYRLSEAGEALFPRAYGALANELLDYLAAEDVERLFDQRRARRAADARARLEGKPLAERVAELARILDEEGYLAEHEAMPRRELRAARAQLRDPRRGLQPAGRLRLGARLPAQRPARCRDPAAHAHRGRRVRVCLRHQARRGAGRRRVLSSYGDDPSQFGELPAGRRRRRRRWSSCCTAGSGATATTAT